MPVSRDQVFLDSGLRRNDESGAIRYAPGSSVLHGQKFIDQPDQDFFLVAIAEPENFRNAPDLARIDPATRCRRGSRRQLFPGRDVCSIRNR